MSITNQTMKTINPCRKCIYFHPVYHGYPLSKINFKTSICTLYCKEPINEIVGNIYAGQNNTNMYVDYALYKTCVDARTDLFCKNGKYFSNDPFFREKEDNLLQEYDTCGFILCLSVSILSLSYVNIFK